MPIPLPAGARPAPPVLDTDTLLGGSRVTDYRITVLDRAENPVGELDDIAEVGGYVQWSNAVAVKGTGQLSLTGTDEKAFGDVDWLNARLRITAVLTPSMAQPYPKGEDGLFEVPLGIWRAAMPQRTFEAKGWTRDIDLTDKLSILDADIPTDENGNPITYAADKGTNVIDLVRELITDTGESADAIDDGDEELQTSMVWNLGTTRLKIINDLLDAAGYYSLYADFEGQFRADVYVAPKDRVPAYSALTPFTDEPGSLMSPEWNETRDIYSVPNRYVAISDGDGEEEGLVGVATNEDPASPYSYQARGLWITEVNDGVEATSQGSIESQAQQGLAQMSSVVSRLEVKHLFLPGLYMNSAIDFHNDRADLHMLCYITKTQVPLDPLALCETAISEAVV